MIFRGCSRTRGAGGYYWSYRLESCPEEKATPARKCLNDSQHVLNMKHMKCMKLEPNKVWEEDTRVSCLRQQSKQPACSGVGFRRTSVEFWLVQRSSRTHQQA